MRNIRRAICPVLAFSILTLFLISFGCITEHPDYSNLTADELADLYLKNSGNVVDYRSEYFVSSGMTINNRVEERIKFDYKSPSFGRVEMVTSDSDIKGSFATSDGTSTSWYDSRTRTYDLSSGMKLSREYDYQRMVLQIVADRNFTILELNTTGGADRYLIEVVTAPWSDKYTPYISSRIQAGDEPSTGLAWIITTYYDCNAESVPTLPPGAIPTSTPPPVDMMPPGAYSRSTVPNREVRYKAIVVNTGIPDSHFTFVPPEGSGPRCVPKYVNYVEPPRSDTSVPIDQPLPRGVRHSLNESDSGRTVTIHPGEVLEITLRTIPGLAYRWIIPTEGSGLELMNAGSIYEMPENFDFMSGNGYYRWRFQAVEPGTITFDGIFSLSGCDIESAKRFNLTVKVTENG